MARFSYKGVEALIYDPVAASRTMGRTALYNLGFRLIETAATVQDFTNAMRRSRKDLVLCECREADPKIFEAIQSLRQDATVYNPFVVIIATAWEKSRELVSCVVNSGADDLVLRPFSPELLGQHIEAHVERRKAFVITASYVGPDRRDNNGRASNVATFDPPNSLKTNTTEALGLEAAKQRLADDLRVARARLNSEKLRCDAFQLCVLCRLLPDDAQDVTENRHAMAALTRTIEQRLGASDIEISGNFCQSVLLTLESLERDPSSSGSMNSLAKSVCELHQAICPEISEAEHRRRIDAAVAAILVRRKPANEFARSTTDREVHPTA